MRHLHLLNLLTRLATNFVRGLSIYYSSLKQEHLQLMQLSNSPSKALESGLKRIAAKDFKGVHADALDMIHAKVGDPVPYCLLGIIAAEHGNRAKALELFQRSAQLNPQEARYHAYLGRTLTELNRQVEARLAADRASGLPVYDALVADTLGVIYSRTGFHERAVPWFRRALELDPRPANFHYNLGASLQFSGDFRAAKAAYLAVLEREPDNHRAYSSLVNLSKQTDADNHLDQLLALFDACKCNPDAALHFGHAIAKTLEDFGQYEESLTWLGKAKSAKRVSLNYDVEADLENFAAAKQTFNRDRSGVSSTHDPAPIFIIGLPRTGTTLVDRILSSHPDVVSAGELNTFAGLIKSGAGTASNRVMDAETLEKARDLDLQQVGRDYVASTQDLARGAVRMTDKMPLNFFYAGLIHAALPNARIVALRRGAMDSCLSNYRQLFSTGFSYYNYTFDLQHTARFYHGFDMLMTHWRTVLPPGRFMEIQYEQIVTDQENQTRRLLEFCALDWNEACLRFHENNAPVSTASSVQVRQPLYSGSIGRWKKYGSALSDLRAHLGDLAEEG